MRPTPGLLAIAAAVIALLAGCTRISERAQPGAHVAGTIPGVLRYGDIAEPDSLNPLISTQSVTADLTYLVYTYFFNADDKDNLVPEAALEVPSLRNGGISRDGKTLVYHLRRGIKWHDGVPLTAKDVVFTFHAIMNPNNNVQVRTGYDQINEVVAHDDYTVIVHMKKVFSPIIAFFMAIQGGYPIMPEHLLAQYPNVNRIPYNSKPIGSGPFKITEWAHGDHIAMVANSDYWRGLPKLKKIVFKILPDDNTILTQLKTHEVDGWFRADAKVYPELQKLPGYVVKPSPQNVFGHIDFNTRDPILQDVRVRQAIELAMDRKRIAADATHGVWEAADSDQQPFNWAYDQHLPRFDYDPERAKKLLDEAGWISGPDGIRVKNGQRLEVQLAYTTGAGVASATASIIQEEERAVGVAIAQKTYPTALYFASAQSGGILNSGKFQMAYFGWVNGVDPDDSSIYMCNQFPPKGQNNLFWCDAKLDAAERDTLSTFDLERRKKDYAVIQEELVTQVPTIFLFDERRIDVYPANFAGFVPSPATSAYWNPWEWEMR